MKDFGVSIATDKKCCQAIDAKLPKRVSKILDGYEFVSTKKTYYLVLKGHHDVLDHMRTKKKSGPMIRGKKRVSPDVSRGATVKITFPGNNGDTFILRRCVRGGMLGRILGRTFFGIRTRMFHETALTAFAMRLGIPVAEILIAAREPIAPFMYRGWILTREIPESQNLRSYLDSQPIEPSPIEKQERRAILSNLARLIAKMHESGIYHGDLHTGNILIQKPSGHGPQVCLIDFDKSDIVKEMNLARRIKNIMRLYRSVIKRPGLVEKISPGYLERFWVAYFMKNRSERQKAGRLFIQYLRVFYIHMLWWRITRPHARAYIPKCTKN